MISKLFMDDDRDTPDGFRRTFSVNSTIAAVLGAGAPLDELSLDNDLGEYYHLGGDGFRVVEFLEWYAMCGFSTLPWSVRVHTANTVAREKMSSHLHGLYRNVSLYPEPTFSGPLRDFNPPLVQVSEVGDRLLVNFEQGQDVDALIAYHLRQGHQVQVAGEALL